MTDYVTNFVAGLWVPVTGREETTIVDPTRGDAVGLVRHSSALDVESAVRAAREAFPAWSSQPVAARADFLDALLKCLADRTESFVAGMADEVGIPVWFGRLLQIPMPLKNGAAAVAGIREMAWEERLGPSLVTKVPYGVVAAITPWNAPLHQIVGKVVAALAAGCTVVLKPSEVAPSTARLFAEAVDEAGLPPGVFNLVWGDGKVGAALVASHEVDIVSFTGSERGGSLVAEAAGRELKKVVLELGGKSAAILLEDAPFEQAVPMVLTQCFANSGQTCVAQSRLLVPAERLDEVEELCRAGAVRWVVGDPRDEHTRIGPLASDAQHRHVAGMIGEASSSGAKLVVGGSGMPDGSQRGYFVKPTVFSNVAPDARLAQEEVFGPVLSIIPYRGDEEAVRITNGTRFGLSGSVWGADPARAGDVASRIRSGQVSLNGAPQNFLAPFGGFKRSGYGRENGRFGVEEFLQLRAIHGAAA